MYDLFIKSNIIYPMLKLLQEAIKKYEVLDNYEQMNIKISC